MSEAKRPEPKVQVFQMRNRLKEKALMGQGAPNAGEAVGVATAALERMEAEFKKAAEDYPKLVGKYLDQLTETYQAIEAKTGPLAPLIEKMNAVAHELKGQGGTFGYPLITAFADSLDKITQPEVDAGDNLPEILKAHVDGMKVVIGNKIEGDGGRLGRELMASLNKVLEKYKLKTK